VNKTKFYNQTFFDSDTIRSAIHKFDEVSKCDSNYSFVLCHVGSFNEILYYESVEDFLNNLKPDFYTAEVWLKSNSYALRLKAFKFAGETSINVKAPSMREIESILYIFDYNASKFQSLPQELKPENPVIFIGHGHSQQWLDLKDHLQDKHDYEVIAYESYPRSGRTIKEILEEMLDESTFALLVLTGEDETNAGEKRARQNVIHETGLFQGRLGFNKAIILLEEGVQEFSNIQGLQQIRFPKGKIIETYGEVLATIKRE
jgi:hypothetical protein